MGNTVLRGLPGRHVLIPNTLPSPAFVIRHQRHVFCTSELFIAYIIHSSYYYSNIIQQGLSEPRQSINSESEFFRLVRGSILGHPNYIRVHYSLENRSEELSSMK